MLPCIDCITYPICKGIYKEVYESTFPDNPKEEASTHVVARILSRNALLRRCSLLKAYLYFMNDKKLGNLYMDNVNELHKFYGENK